MKTRLALLLVALNLFSLSAVADAMDGGIKALQKAWAVANYQTAKEQQDAAFEQLTQQAEALVAQHPGRAEPLIWNAIIVSSHAGATGGLGALGKVKEAHKLLQLAEKINPDALDGSVYTSLGSLYYQVPGWPIGFGDDDRAEQYLKKALAANPEGIDPNYFYGDFLRDQGRYEEAVAYLDKALKAPPRPDRPVADEGRRAEAQKVLATVKAKL
jgi:tetratricopeptide (TPR) repeat protein